MRVWVNGCFDILHTGHLELLEYAKHTGGGLGNFFTNTLIVGIDSDMRVRKLKGKGRPINSQDDRRKMLESLKVVDEVHIFNSENQLRKLIRDLNIDIMVVGDTYKDKEVIGSENSKNGVIFYHVDNRSSTKIIEKIKNL